MHTPMRMPVPCTRAILPSRALLAWVCPLHLRGVPSTPAWCALYTCVVCPLDLRGVPS